jgi:hypothetical protein
VCALYLMVPVPPWWMARMLDEYGIGLLGLPAIAVALAAALGLFALAQKVRHRFETLWDLNEKQA